MFIYIIERHFLTQLFLKVVMDRVNMMQFGIQPIVKPTIQAPIPKSQPSLVSEASGLKNTQNKIKGKRHESSDDEYDVNAIIKKIIKKKPKIKKLRKKMKFIVEALESDSDDEYF